MQIQQENPQLDGGNMTFKDVPFRREITISDIERMNIPKRYWGVKFDEISSDQIGNSGITTKEVARRYIENMSDMYNRGIGFAIQGSNGTGKTSFAVVIAKEFRRRGKTVLFKEASALKRMVFEREIFDENETLWDRSKNVDVLILDDFGKGIMDSNGAGVSLIDELIRFRNSHKKVTFITSNLDMSLWKKKMGILQSTMDTLKECVVPIDLVGKSRRGLNIEQVGSILFEN